MTDCAKRSSTATKVSPARTLLVTASVFGAAFAVAGLAFTAFAVSGSSHESTRYLMDNFLMAGYLVMVGSAFNTVAFFVPAACSAKWRRLSPLGAASRSAFFGLAAFLISLTGLQYRVLRVIPVLQLVPVFGVFVMIFLPGALMGVLAVVAIWLASILGAKPLASPRSGPSKGS